MLRKMLLIAAAVAMPVGAIAVTAGTAAAKVVVPPDPAVTCSVSGTVLFAAPGISTAGSVSLSKTSVTTTTPTTFGAGCTGGGGANTITTKSVKCDKHTAGLPVSNPACVPGSDGYGSWANFVAAGSTSIQKALKKLNFTINGIPYQTKTTAASEVILGACVSEVGFQVVGTVKAPKQDKGQTSTFTACLGAITGSGLDQSTFLGAAGDGVGTVATAVIDPAVSTVHVG
jgi:hypothetical protein